MQNNIALLTLTVSAVGLIGGNRFVAPTGAQAGAGSNTLGVSRYGGVGGDKLPIDVLGTTVVTAGAALVTGALLESDANGCAIPHLNGVPVARVAPGDSAAGAGSLVEVVLIPN